ncbi:MAG: extracellular solute-binding protein [Lachnospiraceae bacterium]|nr:extracellular solute-binding protein [Lachnospiraceae bacterium]
MEQKSKFRRLLGRWFGIAMCFVFCIGILMTAAGCGVGKSEEMVWKLSLDSMDLAVVNENWQDVPVFYDGTNYYYATTQNAEGVNGIWVYAVPVQTGEAICIYGEAESKGWLAEAEMDSSYLLHLFWVDGFALREEYIDLNGVKSQKEETYEPAYAKWVSQHDYVHPLVAMDKAGAVYFYGDVNQDQKQGVEVWVVAPRQEAPVYQFFWEGETLYEIGKDTDGLVVLTGRETAGGSQLIVRKISADGREQYCQKTELAQPWNGFLVLGWLEEELLIKDMSGLYRYDMSEGVLQTLCTWADLDFAGEIMAISGESYADGVQEIHGLARVSGEGYLLRLRQMPASEQVEKQEVVLAGISSLDRFSSAVAGYNMQQTEYRIVLKDYSQGGQLSEQDALNKLNTDLMTGGKIDLLCLDDLDTDMLIQKGYLQDLYRYMDEDSKIQKEDFVPQVLTRMEQYGGLYRMFSMYRLRCLAGPEAPLSQEETWNLEAWMELVRKCNENPGSGMDSGDGMTGGNGMISGDGMAGGSGEGSESDDPSGGLRWKLFYDVDRLELLQCLFLSNRDVFLNAEAGTCAFEDTEFLALLQLIRQIPIQDNTDRTRDIWDYVTEGKVLLQEVTLGDLMELEVYRQMYEGQERLLGYPSADGAVVLLEPFFWQMGICANSAYGEVAWDFLSGYLQKEKEKFAMGTFSTLQSSTDLKWENELTPRYVEGEKQFQVVRSFLNQDVPLYHATEEDVALYEQLLSQAMIRSQADVDIWPVIEEEVQSYLEGQKSAEEVAGIIQNRVQLILNEKQ